MARLPHSSNPPRAPADIPGMDDLSPDDLDDLAAIADAALEEPVETLSLPHPAAPALLLEVTCDGGGIVAATWRLGGAWLVAEVLPDASGSLARSTGPARAPPR